MSIEIITGPMYSGKTTELIRRITRYKLCKKNCVIISHSIDNRYDDDNILINHDGFKISHDDFIKTNILINKIKIFDKYEIIGIDECQFFDSNDLIIFCDTLANNGKKIIVAGLNSDFNKNPFKSIIKLIPISEKITKLQSICNFCYNDATFTMKKINKDIIIEIGGSDLYIPVCRICYNKNNTIN
ncbi:thymidine kinase [Choristoneura rosaceana entomopoxvirus 'L']|uniref:Thymidine kinase n=1 Tax=Choristoneura rosaceana entomopoxvirus 'L' TaxID=1293539 RepID=A0ABM9QK66_9POXV|nr:thymidine kinase [Choristoneura rosaceana entomopoxvirus 'L']CCU55926.1 thymidine kinase [Choristoneura rosaceana entomopoxvirus 'L']